MCADEHGIRQSAWFGPAGTVSPLHFDPYHNLLTQAVGYKYIRLYSPACSARLHPRPELSNNSRINLDDVDAGKYPGFDETPFLHCVLGPGEMLHIPRGWWHYVRSLSRSFSVSFWWGARA